MKNLSAFFLLFSIITVSCKQSQTEKRGISEILERTLSSVVTIKVDETSLGKSAFGFAQDSVSKLSVADIAYSNVLQLEDAMGTGSGFVIERSGKKYIVTNAHVIETAKDMEKNVLVYTYTGKEYKVKFIGADSFYDISVFEFDEEADSTVFPLKFSDGNYKIGETVYAIGNPLGYFPYTVTQGIISAKNRQGQNAKSGYLQSSAMLSAGNSGGPLVNENGELIGVNTLGSQKAQQLNFALESRILDRVINDIIEFGKVKRAYFGFEIIQLYKYIIDENDNVRTALLSQKPRLLMVFPDSPAEEKLKDFTGFNITSMNQKNVTSNDDVLEILESLKPADTLLLGLEKDGLTENFEIVGEELTNERLSQIADYYFQQHYNIRLSKNESGVILNYPYGFQDNSFQVYEPQMKKFRNYVPLGEKSYIIACGNTKDMGELDCWRVKNFKDLGNALRLSTINGQISFLDYNGKNSYIVRILLSDRKDLIRKAILN